MENRVVPRGNTSSTDTLVVTIGTAEETHVHLELGARARRFGKRMLTAALAIVATVGGGVVVSGGSGDSSQGSSLSDR